LETENSRRCKPTLPKPELVAIAKSAVAYDSGELFNTFNSFEPPRLGSAALHGFVGTFVETIGPHTEAPTVGMISQVLAATGMIVGDGVTTYAGDIQPARVNVVLVGRTGRGRKGTSFSHVDRVLRRLPGVGARQIWQMQCVRGLSSGEGLINAVADRKELNEETGKIETVRVEKRLFVIEQEFAKVLAQADRSGNILSHVLRESFECGHLQTLTRESPLRADGAHIVVVGHITPDELRKRLTELEMANGFANRFLWLYVESDKMLPDAKPVPDEVLTALAKEWGEILKFARTLKALERDGETAELWRRVYPALCSDRPGLRGAILGRAETIVTRLSLVYAILDKSAQIRRAHLEAALALWQYSVESVAILFPNKTGDSVSDRLLEILQSGPMAKAEIFKHLAKPVAEINAALAALESAGRIHNSQHKPGGRGRPAEVWELIETL
jgi:hypothetical protein